MTKKLAVAAGLVGILASAGVAFAQTSTSTAAVAASKQPMVLEVTPSGKVTLRGTVDSVSVSGSSLTVRSWGGKWTVNVPTSAQVLPQGVQLSNYAVGDFVGVQGSIDQGSSWTVNAALVRDWSAKQEIKAEVNSNTAQAHEIRNSNRTVVGTISKFDAAARTFTLNAENGTTYAVKLAPSALLLTERRLTLDLSKVNSGDNVRIYGTVASTTIVASILRDASVK